ncbi:MAG TPA: class I SAM-dependent rRNA methyltransferase [Polyangia bacterium]|nr:class I SAM-dependent rRNA methyltransferase [Polyangia bacterium]
MALRKNLARAIRQGHPWLFREALRPPAAPLPDGAVVVVTAPDGRALARGFWDSASPIAVRLFSGADDAADEADDAEPAALVEARAAEALARRLAFIDLARTTAFRLIHGEADRLPGVHADLYDSVAAVRFDGGGARAFYRELPDALERAAARHGIRLTAVIERRRGPRGRETSGPAALLLGALPEHEIVVRENDLLFGVDLVRGQKGGLFLDQRDNRALVGTLASGRRVLNLFAYTGGFSVYAAAGGARATTTVDIGRDAVAAARRNFERNGLDLARAELHAGDAFAFLAGAARAGRRWDIVISDPPSFAPSRRALAQALGAYRRLHRLAAAAVEPGGLLCAASCSSHVDRAAFLRTVELGARDAGRRWSLQSFHGAAADHPTADWFPEGDYLKFAVGRV